MTRNRSKRNPLREDRPTLLSRRESEVVKLMGKGLSRAEISDRLRVSRKCVSVFIERAQEPPPAGAASRTPKEITTASRYPARTISRRGPEQPLSTGFHTNLRDFDCIIGSIGAASERAELPGSVDVPTRSI